MESVTVAQSALVFLEVEAVSVIGQGSGGDQAPSDAVSQENLMQNNGRMLS